MAFTYNGDPSASLLEAIRFYAQDTDSTDVLLTDEEISYLMTQWADVSDNPILRASAVCETVSARFTRELSYSGDGASVNAAELQEKYSRLAADLREQYKAIDVGDGPDVGGILVGEYYDSSIKALSWAKGQHDNVEAGRQNYGGTAAGSGADTYSDAYYF